VIQAMGGIRTDNPDGFGAARRRCSRSAVRRSRRVADFEVGRLEDRARLLSADLRFENPAGGD
jgi:hypothetical protein